MQITRQGIDGTNQHCHNARHFSRFKLRMGKTPICSWWKPVLVGSTDISKFQVFALWQSADMSQVGVTPSLLFSHYYWTYPFLNCEKWSTISNVLTHHSFCISCRRGCRMWLLKFWSQGISSLTFYSEWGILNSRTWEQRKGVVSKMKYMGWGLSHGNYFFWQDW